MSLTRDMNNTQSRPAHEPAEIDDGTTGIHSIPAMLRLLRSHLVTHAATVTQLRDSVPSVLSTVMGSFDPGGIDTKEFRKLMKEKSFSDLNDYIVVPKTTDDDLTAEERSRVSKQLKLLVTRVAENQNKVWVSKLTPVLKQALSDDILTPIHESVEEHVQEARGFALQCVTLYSGRKAAQPFKREAAQVLFEKQTTFLTEKLTCLNTNRKQLTSARNMRTSLTENREFQEIVDDTVLSEKLSRCDSTITTLTHNITSLGKEVVAEFNNGVYVTSELNRISLNIPADILEKSRGEWVRQEIPAWFRNHASELYTVIPYMSRIINDFDPLTGEYWKPPTLLQAEEYIPKAFVQDWEKANRSLATKLVNSMGRSMLTTLTSSYEYGA